MTAKQTRLDRLWRLYVDASTRRKSERSRWERACNKLKRKSQRAALALSHDRAMRQVARYNRLCQFAVEERFRIAREA